MEEIVQLRIQETQKLINENTILKNLLTEQSALWEEAKSMGVVRLITEIQQLWSLKRDLNELESKRLAVLILAYRIQGYDIEYFTQGAGGDCNIM